jgi:hypothetical protein
MGVQMMTRVVLVMGVTVLAVGCATSEEWQEGRGQTAQFAPGPHATFSNLRVVGTDIEPARTENGWAKAITVSPEPVFQNCGQSEEPRSGGSSTWSS